MDKCIQQQDDAADLSAETVERAALALEGVHNVKGRDGLALGVLGVGHGILDDGLEEHTKNGARLVVDAGVDALDTTTACETANGGLGDTLDVIAQDLAMALGATLSETLATLSASSRHDW